jgi:hypothetical protein
MLWNRRFIRLALLFAVTIPYLQADELFDIPGEGNVRCLRANCPDSRGIVTSIPPGLVTGSLLGSAPTFGVNLTGSILFLTFSGGDTFLGPLGLNPNYDPQSIRDSRIPVAGQPIALEITNSTGLTISDVALYLEIPPTVITGPFSPQGDGISFGIWCTAGLAEPRDCANHIALLATPTGPGILNPADLTPGAGPNSTFGDLLRYTNLDLEAGATARFTFFITDRKATLDPSTGGNPVGASRSFNLEIVANPIPEPGTFLLLGAGLLAAVALTRRLHQT